MTEPRSHSSSPFLALLRREWSLVVGLITTGLFLGFSSSWLGDLSNPAWFAFVLVWLFTAILLSALAVVRHAECLAVKLGEPFGTLLLTLSVIGIEVTMIAAVMSTGHGNVTLARDTMFAVVMIVLNGMVGLCLLLGGLRYREQTYNLQGTNAYLAVITPLAVIGLVLPNFTESSPGPTFSPLHSTFLILMSVGLYGVFLAIQTSRHREYFMPPLAGEATASDTEEHHGHEVRSVAYHAPLLLAYLVPTVILAEKMAIPIDYGIHVLRAPPSLGGFLVSVLVLCPEAVAGARAALSNELQRAVNLLLGSVLASISLTIPAAMIVAFFTGQTIVLGLDAANMVLLVLTLVVTMLTFAGTRTNVLLGAVHLLLFVAYVMLIFES
ncbi:calcium:proton antiporter [Planctomycetaceae bacterium SCGC AG-212-D15]|nr:calcium:proton antiporter [Planctomycetaceae bacterium SCGC AG-212-D15]